MNKGLHKVKKISFFFRIITQEEKSTKNVLQNQKASFPFEISVLSYCALITAVIIVDKTKKREKF